MNNPEHAHTTVIKAEKSIGNYTAGKLHGLNMKTTPSENFTNFAHGFTQHLTDEQLSHMLEISWREAKLRENMKKYGKGN